MKNYIFGKGGAAKEIEALIHQYNTQNFDKISIDGFVDKESSTDLFFNKQVLSEEEFFNTCGTKNPNIYLAFADPYLKEKTYLKLMDKIPNCTFRNLIHPTAILDDRNHFIKICNGNFINAFSFMMTNSKIGSFNYLSLYSSLGHDSEIGNYCTLFPNVKIAGNVKIDDKVVLGTSSVVLENLNICSNVIVGAGAVVTKSIIETGTYVGVPAIKIK